MECADREGWDIEPSEYKITCKNGKERTVLISGILTGEKQSDEELLVVFVDLTERKQVEAELEQYRHHLEELVDERSRELNQANAALGAEIVQHEIAEEKLRMSEGTIRNKLNAILEPEGDIGRLVELADIIDVEALRALLAEFYRLTHIGIAVDDIHSRILIGFGWQEICTQFHRIHPDSLKCCIESDTELSKGAPAGMYKCYRCKNNMWDMSTPIEVGGRHVGNVFLGQFFYEDEVVDRELFRRQARQYGFDEEEYLAALDRVPRWSRETVDATMTFYTKLAGMISSLNYAKIKLSRESAQKNLAKEEIRKVNRELEQVNARLDSFNRDFEAFLNQTADFIYFKDINSRFIFCSQTLATITKHANWHEMIGKHEREVFPPDTAKIYEEEEPILSKGQPLLNKVDPYYDSAGKSGYVLTNKWPLFDASGKVAGIFGISRDITERIRAEYAIKEKSEALARANLEITHSEQKFRAIAEQGPFGIVMTDHHQTNKN